MKLKSFCKTKNTVNRTNWQPTDWGKKSSLTLHLIDRGLITSKILLVTYSPSFCMATTVIQHVCVCVCGCVCVCVREKQELEIPWTQPCGWNYNVFQESTSEQPSPWPAGSTWQWNRHGVKSQRTSTWYTMCKSSVVLSGKLVHVPEPPGWEDNHSQHMGVNKLTQSLGTNPAHNRHTFLQEGEMRDISPFMWLTLKPGWECSSEECLRSWAQSLTPSSSWISTSDCLEPNQHQ